MVLGDSLLQNSNSSSDSFVLQQTNASTNTRAPPTTLMNPGNYNYTLPKTNVTRMMKKCLPENSKISEGAKAMVDQCTTKFISWVTKKANQRCQSESRAKLCADDLLWALNTLGYHNYSRSLNVYLERYRYSNKIDESVQLFGEISRPSLPPPNPILEIVEAMDMDDFWAELDNRGSGSSDNALTTFYPSTECFDDILDESDDKMNE